MTARPDALDARLAAAGAAGLEPVAAWRRLHEAEGARATVIDLYELVGRARGVAAHELPQDERHALAREVMPDVWPGWATTPNSRRTGDVIRIVDHDPSWPHRFADLRDRIRGALGPVALRIEHVGSTSVPDLPAKPIIDVQVSVADPDAEDGYVPALAGLGLQLRSRDHLHRYFRPFPGRPRDTHVHVCRIGSPWEAEHLRFRDILRADARARRRYAEVKRAAAARWSDDGIAYTDAKSSVILSILADGGPERE